MLGNLSSRSRGFNSLPVKVSQPAGSESCMGSVATSPMKRRQQVLKPRGSLDINITLKKSAHPGLRGVGVATSLPTRPKTRTSPRSRLIAMQ